MVVVVGVLADAMLIVVVGIVVVILTEPLMQR